MLRYAIGKITHMVLVLLLVSFFTAVLMDLTPGDPAYAVLGFDATPEAVAAVHADLGLDRSIFERYGEWLVNVLHGDFGESYRANVAAAARVRVTDAILSALPVTAELIVLALALALVVAIPVGVYTAFRKGGLVDRMSGAVFSVLVSSPPFVTAPVLVLVLVVWLGLFPATGWVSLGRNPLSNLFHAFVPALTLAVQLVPSFAIVLRSDMVATLQENFILNARAKGLSTRRILIRHALRPSSFSLVTSAGIALGSLIGGAVIVEYLFALPGVGTLLLSAIMARDINTVQGVVMFIALTYVLVNTGIDLAYGVLDPRVRLRGVG